MQEWLIERLKEALERVHIEVVLLTIVQIVGLILFAWILNWIIIGTIRKTERGLIQRHENPEDDKRVQTLMRLLRQSVRIIIWGVVGLMVLKKAGFDLAPLLASAGVVGLAIGFGAQNLVRDVISGLFLILENQVRVGDVLRVGDVAGVVERISMRTISLRDVKGVLHILPNGGIDRVSNLTYSWSAYVFDIGVAYRSNVDEVIQILKEVGESLRKDENLGPKIIDEVEVFGLDQMADSALVIKGRIKTLPSCQWEVGRAFLKSVKKTFDERGIEIPFPQRTLHFSPELERLFKEYPHK